MNSVEIENTIDIGDFMSLFVAVSFLQEQRYFNIFNLKIYLKEKCGISSEELEEIDDIIDNMVDAGMINLVTNSHGLFKINKKVPFKEIIFDNQEKLNQMINFFYNFYSYDFASIKNKYEENINIRK